MAQATPIACSLNEQELPRRVAEAAALGAAALVDVRTDGPEASLHFRLGNGISERLDALRRAESECCPFFGFELKEGEGELVLSIDVPVEGIGALRGLVAAFISGWEAAGAAVSQPSPVETLGAEAGSRRS